VFGDSVKVHHVTCLEHLCPRVAWVWEFGLSDHAFCLRIASNRPDICVEDGSIRDNIVVEKQNPIRRRVIVSGVSHVARTFVFAIVNNIHEMIVPFQSFVKRFCQFFHFGEMAFIGIVDNNPKTNVRWNVTAQGHNAMEDLIVVDSIGRNHYIEANAFWRKIQSLVT